MLGFTIKAAYQAPLPHHLSATSYWLLPRHGPERRQLLDASIAQGRQQRAQHLKSRKHKGHQDVFKVSPKGLGLPNGGPADPAVLRWKTLLFPCPQRFWHPTKLMWYQKSLQPQSPSGAQASQLLFQKPQNWRKVQMRDTQRTSASVKHQEAGTPPNTMVWWPQWTKGVHTPVTL